MTHVTLTSEHLKHDWTVTSLQPTEAVTLFRHLMLLFCRSVWALLCLHHWNGFGTTVYKSVQYCEVHLSHKMMHFCNKILMEKSEEIIQGQEN